MLTPQQKSARMIGGSSSAAILGLSKYRTRYQEWLRCTGQEQEEDLTNNIHIKVGNLIEPIIARLVKERGYDIKTGCDQEIHPDYPYISRNLDGIEGDIIHEFKTALSFMRKQFDDAPIPQYNCQIQHYALWPGVKKMYLHTIFIPMEMKEMLAAVSFTDEQLYDICKGLELLTQEVKPDFIIQEYMLEKYAEFWEYVESNTPPPAQSIDELTSMFLQSESGSIPATDADIRALTEIKTLKEKKKEIESKIKEKQFIICDHLQENEQLIYNGKKIASWKTQESKRVDTQALKDAGLYEKYCKISKSRVFRG